jgi:hypothetical protein
LSGERRGVGGRGEGLTDTMVMDNLKKAPALKVA